MPSDASHWNKIFGSKEDEKLGWFESEFTQTMRFISQANPPENSRVFLPGAGKSGLCEQLVQAGYKLIINDISDVALAKLKNTIDASRCEFLHHNMSEPLPQPCLADMWVDRAVLHFLLTEQEITGYFDNVKSVVKSGGHVLLAEFSTLGANKCAGLPVHQYTLEEMVSRLGTSFALVYHEEHTFLNPFGEEKPYIYGLFKRS